MDEKEYNDIDSLISDIKRDKSKLVSDNVTDETGELVSVLKNIHGKNSKPVKINDSEDEIPEEFEDSGRTMQMDAVGADSNSVKQAYEPEIPQKPVKKKRPDKAAIARKKHLKRRKNTQRTIGHIFGGILLAVVIVAVSVYLGIFVLNAALDFTGIAMTEFDVEIEIPEDATTEEIAEILEDHGLIEDPRLFEIYAKISDKDNTPYISGLFTLSSTMSYSTIIDTLQTVVRQQQTVTVRIVEGMTAEEIAELLEENGVCRAEDFRQFYKNKMNEYSFEKRVLENSLKYYQLEGYLFPDTYEFFVIDELAEQPDLDTSDEASAAAKKIYQNFNSKITIPMYQRINAMGLTLDEAITLASMVQAEAGTPEDMGLVASVFLNRLHNSAEYPKLQSDVTVIYVENNIRPYYNRQDEINSYETFANAYNTYVVDGLPAGPVCNPGMDAIEAVLNAPDTSYLYFCADEDTLEMYYASTLAEHEQNLLRIGLG